MKKLLIIMGSPRQDGICQELINQVRKYFLDCEIKLYDSYKLAPSPCTDCKWCEYHDGCSNKDLDIFFEDFEDADYIAFFTPVYNNFFPAPIKAILWLPRLTLVAVLQENMRLSLLRLRAFPA
jgi:multimeric flavodoxin WrbA